MLTFLKLDAEWSARLRIAERPGWLRNLAAFLAHSGDSWFWMIGLAILFVVGSYPWKLWAFKMGISIVILAALVMAIKFTVRRRRPEGEWGALYRKTDPHSFPSGHAARALMLAVLAVGIGPGWLAGIMIVWAPLVALARVAMGLHYLSDILAGGIIGLAAGGLLAQALR